MQRLLPGLLALLVAAACATPARPPFPDPTGRGKERQRWLFEQRAYPFGEIPADARRKALDQVRTRERLATLDVDTNAAALSWRPIGPLPIHTLWPWKTATGRVKALAISPQDPRVILAGSSSGGIWRSIDAGQTFAPVSDHHVDLSIGAIAFAPSNPSLAYAASGSDFLGTGVLRSTDAGATWQVVSGSTFPPRGTANRLVVDPFDPNRLWLSQTSQQDGQSGNVYSSGLLLSENGGVSWKMQFPGIISDFAASPVSPSTLLIGVQRNDGDARPPGVYRSTDGGRTWAIAFPRGTSYPNFVFGFSPASPSRVYLHSHTYNDTPRFHASDDGGATWRDVPSMLPADAPIFLVPHPSSPNRIFLGYHGGDLHVSDDAGATWQNVTRSRDAAGEFVPHLSTTHIDQHALVFVPGDDRTFYLGNDGGIFKTTDGGTTFTSLAGTLSLVQAYRISAHPTDPSLLFLGSQDNGIERRKDGQWRELFTGDYGSVLFDANDPSTFITNYVYGTTFVFTGNGDGSIVERTNDNTFKRDRTSFIAPFEHHRATNTLYFGTWRLYASPDFGRTWTTPGGTFDLTKNPGDTLSAIGLSASDPGTIYTGSRHGRVMLSRDRGTTWFDVTRNLPDRFVSAIAVDRQDPAHAFIAFSGYRSAHVYRTTDFGERWQAVTAGLPDVPVNALMIDPSNAAVVYAGTDVGPFRLEGNQWQFIGAGMPPVVVTSFDVTANGRIVASTYGRGAYELVTPQPGPRRRSVRH